MSVVVQFPPPPSANTLRAVSRGRLINSKEYRKWLLDAFWSIRGSTPMPPVIETPCAVSLKFPKLRANADLDNRIKPSLDALQKSGVIKDDKLVIRIMAQWAKPGETVVTAEVHEVQA